MQSVAMHRNNTIVTIKLVFALKKKSGRKIKKKYRLCGAKTHRSFVSQKFLYDFNQLVLLLWIQTAKERGINEQNEKCWKYLTKRTGNHLFFRNRLEV